MRSARTLPRVFRVFEGFRLTRLPKVFAGIVIGLTLMHIATQLAVFYLHDFYGLAQLFDLNGEWNVPAMYSAFALFVCSVLLARITVRQHQHGFTAALPWAGLAAIFFFLSLDEAKGYHERLTLPLRTSLHTSGLFYYAWVIPYGVALLVLLLLYFKFLLALPPRIRWLFIISGIIYVSGAMGLEMVGGWYVELYGKGTLLEVGFTMLEEFCEMAGVVLFMHAITLLG